MTEAELRLLRCVQTGFISDQSHDQSSAGICVSVTSGARPGLGQRCW